MNGGNYCRMRVDESMSLTTMPQTPLTDYYGNADYNSLERVID